MMRGMRRPETRGGVRDLGLIAAAAPSVLARSFFGMGALVSLRVCFFEDEVDGTAVVSEGGRQEAKVTCPLMATTSR